ncbi:PEP-CTERM sorting domain-containing protein [Tropicibacter sp. S64]|uniref:PEP-CTERM sorting domain-containing protein n=1 Tax=Tropicibacter sp. S64 TaxID=3415122 RepID=UPI003C79B956
MKTYLIAAALTGLAGTVSAATATDVVYKLSDSASYSAPKADAYTTWIGGGGLNEGVSGAADLTANGIDYKSSWVESNWGDVLSVLVGIYDGGVLQAYVEFDAAGTTKTDFFDVANVLSSSWSDITSASHNFFSPAGDGTYSRRWFINSTYGGCGSDSGHMVVVEAVSSPCVWENNNKPAGDPSRMFFYADAGTAQLYQGGSVATGDVFAISVTYTVAAVPVPASGLLLAGALGLFGLRRRRKG